jgi:hypothetical protein
MIRLSIVFYFSDKNVSKVKLIPYQNTGQISRTNQSDHLFSVPKQFPNILEQKKQPSINTTGHTSLHLKDYGSKHEFRAALEHVCTRAQTNRRVHCKTRLKCRFYSLTNRPKTYFARFCHQVATELLHYSPLQLLPRHDKRGVMFFGPAIHITTQHRAVTQP